MNEKESILIVDDNESTCRTLTLIFGKKGYETETAGMGREAIEKARGRFFNLALVDVKLPDVEGVELVGPLKEMHPDMVVIMVTAHASMETAVQALNEGASAYITKPLNMDEVLATLREALEKQRLVIENRRLFQEAQRELAERKRVEEELRQAKEAADLARMAAEEAREAAEAANRAKSAFLANVSHELRTPLNAILGFAQLMTRSQNLPLEHQENLSIISRSGEHLLTLINDVLDMSKIEAGRTTLNKRSFDLYRLLDDLEDMFYLRTADKHLQLVFDRTPDVPQYVRTDESKLRQVLINLLGNAAKFTHQGGIALRVAADGDRERKERGSRENLPSLSPSSISPLYLHFEVKDTGPGIAPDELDTLFEAFVQTTAGQQTQEGTGLGLPISYQFVQLMGGEMRVESQVGGGTTFKFDIQCELADPIENPRPKIQNRVIALEPNQPHYRILIVEDIKDNCQLLVELLNPLGFELREASNGQEALEVWGEWEPHLIWMDIWMPVMDGYEATRRIKATAKGQATVVIALTASIFEEDRARILAAGCDDLVYKPFREEEIFDMLAKHLGVRFVYEEISKSANTRMSKSKAGSLQDTLTLEGIPSEWLAELHQATLEGDLGWMAALIDQVREQDATLAKTLANLARDFDHDTILALIEKARE